MNADPRMPIGTPDASPALSTRRTRRASIQTRRNSATISSATLPHQRPSSLHRQAYQQGTQMHDGDSPNCMCTACHLNPAVFPRRQDGRIVLPIPWLLSSESVPRPAPQNLPGLSGEIEDHVPNVAEATRTDDYALHNWVRRLEGFSTQNVERNTDRGEGPSRVVPRLSGPGVAPTEETSPALTSHLNISDNVEPRRRRSNTDRSRSYPYPNPYAQGASVLHTAGLEASYRPGIDPSAVYLRRPSPLVTTTQPSTTEVRSWRDPYGNTSAGPSQSLEPRPHLGNQSVDPSTSSTVHSHGAPNDHRFSTPSISTRSSRPVLHTPKIFLDQSLVPSTPARNKIPATSHRNTSSRLQLLSSLGSPWDQTRNTHFSIHSQHIEPSTSESSHKAASRTASTGDLSHQSKLPVPTSAPSSSSFTWRPGDEEQENAIRFQEPVVHDPTIISDQQDGQVEIKWDTERKRRQGYFSQAEGGSEKSNFRLYNQSKIDFGS